MALGCARPVCTKRRSAVFTGTGLSGQHRTGCSMYVARQSDRCVRQSAPVQRHCKRNHVLRGRLRRPHALATEISAPGDSTGTGDRSHTTDCVVIGSGIGGEAGDAVYTAG